MTKEGLENFLNVVKRKAHNFNPEERERNREIQEQVHRGGRNNLINTLREEDSEIGILEVGGTNGRSLTKCNRDGGKSSSSISSCRNSAAT